MIEAIAHKDAYMFGSSRRNQKKIRINEQHNQDIAYTQKQLDDDQHSAYRKMMIERLQTVDLKEEEFEDYIKYTKESLIESLSKDELKKLMIVINKGDFILNFELSETEYVLLEKALDIKKEKEILIYSNPKTLSIDYWIRPSPTYITNEFASPSKQMRPEIQRRSKSPLSQRFKHSAKGQESSARNVYHSPMARRHGNTSSFDANASIKAPNFQPNSLPFGSRNSRIRSIPFHKNEVGSNQSPVKKIDIDGDDFVRSKNTRSPNIKRIPFKFIASGRENMKPTSNIINYSGQSYKMSKSSLLANPPKISRPPIAPRRSPQNSSSLSPPPLIKIR